MSRVAIIINPISGTGGRRDAMQTRVRLAASLADAHGLAPLILVSERHGHIRELAREALDAGATDVIAWGGDGTIHDVASVLTFGTATLGIVPSGSGNGLARELGVPLTPAEAFAVAVGGRERVIDCGEIDGRVFFNIAGIGLDARIAHQFAALGHARRGFRRYLEIGAREIFRFQPDDYTIRVDQQTIQSRAMVVAVANGCQYGNGAAIAPKACLDDGLLDVVVIEDRSAVRALTQVWRVFAGQVDRAPGVRILRGSDIEIRATQPMIYHLDGETHTGGTTLRARSHARALRVRIPRGE